MAPGDLPQTIDTMRKKTRSDGGIAMFGEENQPATTRRITYDRGTSAATRTLRLSSPGTRKAKERLANTWIAIRSSSGVPGHRPPLAHRDQPHPGSVPHANLRSQPRRRQVPVLVLHAGSEEGQEGHR